MLTMLEVALANKFKRIYVKIKVLLSASLLFSINYLFSMQSEKFVHKYTLENGMTVLVLPNAHSFEVAMMLWYDVGAKHEGPGERGMAHFIEHMIFKGTHTMLSESDLNVLSAKLSSYINAFTWYDYTGYVFKLPLPNWEKILPVFADCMQNCRFLQDHMDSEVKAVVQELDMRADKHTLLLQESLASTIFDMHPYHYPVIGFKQDLSALKQDTLVKFYKKHYIPQNATLVLVGNIDPDQAFEKVSQHFASIARGSNRAATDFYFNNDIQTKSVTLYRDVAQPIATLAFVLPGKKEFSRFFFTILANVLTDGMSSRLYKKLITEKALVTSISADDLGTFEKELFYFMFVPKNAADIPVIKEIILQEIQNIIDHGVSTEELNRAVKAAQMERQCAFESVYNLAKEIGYSYLATGNEQAIFEAVSNTLADDIQVALKTYFRKSACHEGCVLPVITQDRDYFEKTTDALKALSVAMLAKIIRESGMELARYADTITVNKFEKQSFPKPHTMTLSNGLEVLLCHSNAIDVVKCELSLKASSLYDPAGFEGIGALCAKMMLEGTKDLPGMQFVDEIGSYGISMSTSAPGSVSACMLPEDISRGLGYVRSMLTDASFDQAAFDKIKDKQLMQIKKAQDDPFFVLDTKVEGLMYPLHPYSKVAMGTQDSIQKIDRELCFNFYEKYASPSGARLVIVGNYDQAAIEQTVKDVFESWHGEQISDLEYPAINSTEPGIFDIAMNRDQVYLGFFAPSIKYLDEDMLALQLYSKLLFGFDSALFALREQTGLFYNIRGGLTVYSLEQPGIVLVKTMVAPNRVVEAQEKIVEVLVATVDLVTDEDIQKAQEKMIHDYIKDYETLSGKAEKFLFLKRFNLPFDYFEQQIDKIRSMTKEDMQKIVKKYLTKDKISCIRVGKF